MGWDISYHPIAEDQIKEWYFDVLLDQARLQKNADRYGIEPFYKQKYVDTIKVALETAPDAVFDTAHGYYIAVIQGFFNKYFYIRGGALSFLENDLINQYFKPWQQIIPENFANQKIQNQITTNYCSGVYIPKEKVVQLFDDYQSDATVKATLDELFSHNRITVFLKALAYAKANELGLLEATEVVEPNPIDLNQSVCYSNLFNCDPEGAQLYQQTAMEQLAAIEEKEGLESGTISNNASYEISNTEPGVAKKSKGFWSKLFGN